MKIKLNEALKSYDAYLKEDDGASMTADVQVATADIDASVTSKEAIIADVDHIITSLETLAGQVQEMVESLDSEAVNEEGAGSKVLQWTITAPKARKAQSKVNQMKLNALDLEMAKDAAQGDKKAALDKKLTITKEKIKEVQQTVADRFDAKGDIVKNARLSAKIQGERELLKRLTGMEDNPKKKAELKTQIAKLDKKQAEQNAALKSMKPDDSEKAAAKNTSSSSNSTEGGSEGGNNEKGNTDKIAKVENDIKTYGKNIDDTNQAIRDNEAKVKKMEAEKEKSTDPDKIQKDIDGIKKRIEADKEDIKDMQNSRNNLKKELAKLSPREQLAVRADLIGLNEMAIEIMGKEDWQFENNSVLYNKYNSIITKAESAVVLNESRYFNNSIKDVFSKLI